MDAYEDWKVVRWCRTKAPSHNSQGVVDGGVNKAGMSTAAPNRSAVGEIRDLWAKIYIFFDAIPAACRKWLKVGFRKAQRVPIVLVPKKKQNVV